MLSAARFGSPCQPRMSWLIGSTAHSSAATTAAGAPQSGRTKANVVRNIVSRIMPMAGRSTARFRLPMSSQR